MTISLPIHWHEYKGSKRDKYDKIVEIINHTDVGVIGSPTYSTIQHIQDIFHSAGWFSGGTITDVGSGNITVSAGTGALRSTDSRVGQLLFFDWGALSSTAIPSDTIRYIGVEYNFGSPQVVVRSSINWNFNTDFPLGTVVNESGTLHITQSEHAVGDHANFMIQRIQEINGIQRANQLGGLIIGEDGSNRYITVTVGILWDGLKSFSISAIDTNPGGGADTFDRYYQDGGSGWTKEANQTTWNNTQYDDGDGGLATMTANFRSVQYFYLELDGTLVSIYGQAEYATVALAENDAPPSTLPDRLDPDHAILIGRIVFQKSASSGDPQTVFMAAFETAGVTAHSDLSGIGASDHHIKTINTGDLSAGELPYARGGTNTDLGGKTVDGMIYNSGGTELEADPLTISKLNDLIMFGAANSAWVSLVMQPPTETSGVHEANYTDRINCFTGNPSLAFVLPIPSIKRTVNLTVTGFRYYLFDAFTDNYVGRTRIFGQKADGTLSTLYDDTSAQNSVGMKESGSGSLSAFNLAVGSNNWEFLILYLNTTTITSTDLEIGVHQMNCYYS